MTPNASCNTFMVDARNAGVADVGNPKFNRINRIIIYKENVVGGYKKFTGARRQSKSWSCRDSVTIDTIVMSNHLNSHHTPPAI